MDEMDRRKQEIMRMHKITMILQCIVAILSGILGILTILVIVKTNECNKTIATHEGWIYITEGEASYLTNRDCYGLVIKEGRCRIGDAVIGNDLFMSGIYTPTPYNLGYRTVHFGALWSSAAHPRYELYEKDFLWFKDYLVICR
jgi:hypothetical protein